jgi:NAD(P)H dehydrogenase (quinone)
MGQGVAEGAKAVSGTDVGFKKVTDVTADDLLACDALIVGSPIYFANMSGEIKSFFDCGGPSLSCLGTSRCGTRSAPPL